MSEPLLDRIQRMIAGDYLRETSVCRHCDQLIYRFPDVGVTNWYHRGKDGFPWRGCRAATHSSEYPYWDDSLARNWTAEP